MYLEPTGRGTEVAVRFDVHACDGCGASFDRLGTYRPDHRNCGHHPSGHWQLTCRACGHVTDDTTCTTPAEPHNPLGGHGHAPASWNHVQHGPTVDLGD